VLTRKGTKSMSHKCEIVTHKTQVVVTVLKGGGFDDDDDDINQKCK